MLRRPEPKALWAPSLPESEWKRQSHVVFRPGAGFGKAGKEDSGTWEKVRKMDDQWSIAYNGAQDPETHAASDLHIALRLGLTWGSQKAEDKDRVLHQFSEGLYDVLVSTTVIEVGVNNPNATIMIIENAERYGLSQLHQLRGRVGRGREESWCFLFAEPSDKLQVFCSTNDGFVIAQKDLELRGPGDLIGTRQSGEAGKQAAVCCLRTCCFLTRLPGAYRNCTAIHPAKRSWRRSRRAPYPIFQPKGIPSR